MVKNFVTLHLKHKQMIFFKKLRKSYPNKYIEIKTTSLCEEEFYRGLLKRAFFTSFSKKYNNLKEALKDVPNKLICTARELDKIDEVAMYNQGYCQLNGFAFNINKAKEVTTRIVT